jgi:hypothetical protein
MQGLRVRAEPNDFSAGATAASSAGTGRKMVKGKAAMTSGPAEATVRMSGCPAEADACPTKSTATSWPRTWP